MDGNEYKIVLIGDSGVGKSSLVYFFLHNKQIIGTVPTIGAAFSIKNVTIGSKNVKFNIWDSAGQERYRSLVKLYYHNTTGCLCVFDISNHKTFENIDFWINDYKRNTSQDSIIVLVANKSELDQSLWQVSENEINELVRKYGCDCILTSCVTGQNVNEVFFKLAELISNKENDSPLPCIDKKEIIYMIPNEEKKAVTQFYNCRC
jgi:small GTP-binding protein